MDKKNVFRSNSTDKKWAIATMFTDSGDHAVNPVPPSASPIDSVKSEGCVDVENIDLEVHKLGKFKGDVTARQREGSNNIIDFEGNFKDDRQLLSEDSSSIRLGVIAQSRTLVAPSNGRLRWETFVTFKNYGIEVPLGGGGRSLILIHAFVMTYEDLTGPDPTPTVHISGNLFNYSEAGPNYSHGEPVRFYGDIPVRAGQQSRVLFALACLLSGIDGSIIQVKGAFSISRTKESSGIADGITYSYYVPDIVHPTAGNVFIKSPFAELYIDHRVADKFIGIADSKWDPVSGAFNGTLWQIVDAGGGNVFIKSPFAELYIDHRVVDKFFGLADSKWDPVSGAFNGTLWQIISS